MTDQLVTAIHASPNMGVIIVTGGGTEIFPLLLKHGGGSATLLDGLIPYTEAKSIQILGGKPDKLVSEQATRMMAMAAYQEAVKLSSGSSKPLFGLASSSILQRTPTEREGREHVIYVALQTLYKTISATLVIGSQDDFRLNILKENTDLIRTIEEKINATMILNLLVRECTENDPIKIGFGLDEKIIYRYSHENILSSLLNGSVNRIGFDVFNGEIIRTRPLNFSKENIKIKSSEPSSFILPGSFNPCHSGHKDIAKHVEIQYGCVVDFELSIGNWDKPMLDFISLEERIKTCGTRTVWVTNAPRFIDKAEIFPNTTFIVGYDTAKRLVDSRVNKDVMYDLERLNSLNTKFIVFGREVDGEYKSGVKEFPVEFQCMAHAIKDPLKSFDISSTKIRKQGFIK